MPGAQLGANVALLEETQRAVKNLFSDSARASEAERIRQESEQKYGKSAENAGFN